MSEKRIVGVSPWSNPNYKLMREAGVEWVRVNIPLPFVDRLGGELSPRFLKVLEDVKNWTNNGFKVMGVTPLAGTTSFDKETGKQSVWHRNMPEWAGEIDTDLYYETYEKICEYMAEYTRDLIGMWQVSNEMDIEEFRGPMNREQAARFMQAGGRGVKKGNPDAKPGINPASWDPVSWGTPDGRWLIDVLYNEKNSPFDYAGIDGYYGSWSAGGPEDWIVKVDEIFDVAKKPVLINEWGYGSIGGPAKESLVPVAPGQCSVCNTGAFHNVWKKEHSEAEQAEYISTALKIFATYPNILGSFFYSWGDSATCWHCGQPNCPAECGWGVVDKDGNPKPSYYAFKETALKYY